MQISRNVNSILSHCHMHCQHMFLHITSDIIHINVNKRYKYICLDKIKR